MTITPEVQLTYYTFRFLNLRLRVNSPNEQLSFSVFISSSRCVVFVLTDEQWCGVCLPSAHHLLLSVSSGSSPPLIIFALTAIFFDFLYFSPACAAAHHLLLHLLLPATLRHLPSAPWPLPAIIIISSSPLHLHSLAINLHNSISPLCLSLTAECD